MAYFKCSGENPTGNAVEADVLSGKTFSNENGTDKTGTMPNRGAVSATLDTSTTSYTVPAGYHNGSGTVSIATQTKSATPSTSAQTISPDSGKVLSSVSVAAISPVRSAGTAAVASGIDSTGPYVYFPYGWWPNGGSSRNYTRMTAAQAVAACPKEEKTSTPTTRSATAATVTPSSGKLLSKVTVNTNSVPNSNSGTYTFPVDSTGATYDMGATNTIRKVNAVNVYAKGKADGRTMKWLAYGEDTNVYVPYKIIDVSKENEIFLTISVSTHANYKPVINVSSVQYNDPSGASISYVQTDSMIADSQYEGIAWSERYWFNVYKTLKLTIPANTLRSGQDRIFVSYTVTNYSTSGSSEHLIACQYT